MHVVGEACRALGARLACPCLACTLLWRRHTISFVNSVWRIRWLHTYHGTHRHSGVVPIPHVVVYQPVRVAVDAVAAGLFAAEERDPQEGFRPAGEAGGPLL